MGKLKREYGNKPDEILISKPKGKLSIREIQEFMNEREQINVFAAADPKAKRVRCVSERRDELFRVL